MSYACAALCRRAKHYTGHILHDANAGESVWLHGPNFTNMFQNAIEAVGSYREIFQRESEYPRTPINTVNSNPHGPQHYPFPGLQVARSEKSKPAAVSSK